MHTTSNWEVAWNLRLQILRFVLRLKHKFLIHFQSSILFSLLVIHFFSLVFEILSPFLFRFFTPPVINLVYFKAQCAGNTLEKSLSLSHFCVQSSLMRLIEKKENGGRGEKRDFYHPFSTCSPPSLYSLTLPSHSLFWFMIQCHEVCEKFLTNKERHISWPLLVQNHRKEREELNSPFFIQPFLTKLNMSEWRQLFFHENRM